MIDLAALIEGLEEAERLTEPRASAKHALNTICSFLEGIPTIEQRNLHAPLYTLLLALDDLERSTVSPMLEGAGSPNRHPARTAERVMKAYCSYLVDRLMAGGDPLRNACRKVADALKGEKLLEGRDGWKTIKNWRDGTSKLDLENHERAVLDALRAEVDPRVIDLADVPALIKRLHAKMGRFG